MNRAEKLVSNLCANSFLSLWSYSNPKGKKGKELCDILVVCDPDVVIFSVKEVKVKDSGNISVDWERWRRGAIESSYTQIYGAERWISNTSHVITKEGKTAIPFPSLSHRRIHRVAVALGSQGKRPIMWGDFGKGFVHVFDEASLNIILKELDTISDFTQYLINKESLHSRDVEILFQGSEEDLLAFYLHNGRQFPSSYDCLVIGDDLWAALIEKPEYQAKKVADEESYLWDRVIETISQDFQAGRTLFGGTLSQTEMVLRAMARESRFSRRVLAKTFKEVIGLVRERKQRIRARIVPALSSIVYVFLAAPHTHDRTERFAELGGRCFVARGLHQDKTTVVGIATEPYEGGKGFSLDLFYLEKDTWTAEDKSEMEYVQKEFGFFRSPEQTCMHEDEYPPS